MAVRKTGCHTQLAVVSHTNARTLQETCALHAGLPLQASLAPITGVAGRRQRSIRTNDFPVAYCGVFGLERFNQNASRRSPLLPEGTRLVVAEVNTADTEPNSLCRPWQPKNGKGFWKPERYETLHSSVVNALLERLSRDDIQRDRSELNRLTQRRRELCEVSTEGDSEGGLTDRHRKTDRLSRAQALEALHTMHVVDIRVGAEIQRGVTTGNHQARQIVAALGISDVNPLQTHQSLKKSPHNLQS